MDEGDSAPGGRNAQLVAPHGLSSCKAMAFWVCREASGSKLQVFVEAQTQPTHGVCRQAGILKAESSNPKRAHNNPLTPPICIDYQGE